MDNYSSNFNFTLFPIISHTKSHSSISVTNTKLWNVIPLNRSNIVWTEQIFGTLRTISVRCFFGGFIFYTYLTSYNKHLLFRNAPAMTAISIIARAWFFADVIDFVGERWADYALLDTSKTLSLSWRSLKVKWEIEMKCRGHLKERDGEFDIQLMIHPNELRENKIVIKISKPPPIHRDES